MEKILDMLNNLHPELIWLLVSFIYIGILVVLGLIFYQVFHWKSESVRKFIHILTANWVFIVIYKMKDPFMMLLGPVLFIFVNAVFTLGGFGKYLGMGDRKRDNGLIYYPISITVLLLLMLNGIISGSSVMCGVLIMGWGDGFAALIGSKIGKHSYKVFQRYKKSVEGTITMAVVSFAVIMLFSICPWYYAVLIAAFAALLENITPFGFDNISVPILSSLLLEVLCHL